MIQNHIAEIKSLYTEQLHSLQMIADKFGCTRSYIKKLLNAAAVSTAKGVHTYAAVECLVCGKPFRRTRARIRNSESRNAYCSLACYHASLQSHHYVEDRAASQKARLHLALVILHCVKLPRGSIVHHIDGNQANNDARNLMLLDSQANHVRLHRACPLIGPEPILFDGRLASPAYIRSRSKTIAALAGVA